MSREKKFTTGPWRYAGFNLIGNSPNGIACFAGFPGEANANLIAAAPELLEALEVMVKIAEFSEWSMATTGRQIALKNAISAIKKAYGETK